MKILLLVIEFFVSIGLIAAVLLHSAKGEGIGGIGGTARLFGSQKGMEAGLNRITTVLAALFMFIAFVLSVLF